DPAIDGAHPPGPRPRPGMTRLAAGRIPVKPACAFALVLCLLVHRPTDPVAEKEAGLSPGPPPARPVAPGARAPGPAPVCFVEGPAVDQGGNVCFSDVTGNRILKMTPHGEVSVFREDSGRANGNAFDAGGRLVTCEGFGLGPGGRRRIVRTDMKTGKVTVLNDPYQGKRYNTPNSPIRGSKDRA